LWKNYLVDPPVDWDEVVSLGLVAWVPFDLCKLNLAAVVYHIWLQKNIAIRHGSTPSSEEQILNVILGYILSIESIVKGSLIKLSNQLWKH
jgi:hypothetical protein